MKEGKVTQVTSMIEKDLEGTTLDGLIPISAKEEKGLDGIISAIEGHLAQMVGLKLSLPNNDDSQGLISWLYEHSNVHSVSFEEGEQTSPGSVEVELMCEEGLTPIIFGKCRRCGGAYQLLENQENGPGH